VGHIAHVGEMRNAYKILVIRPRHRWEDNIKMELREMRWEGVDWIHLSLDRDQLQAVNMVLNLWVL